MSRDDGMQHWLERLGEAYVCQAQGQDAMAESLARSVLQAAPQQPMALHLLGVLLLRTARAAEAESVLAQAATLRPENNDTILAHADALAATGAHADALAQYRRVLARQPRRPDALVNAARAHQKLGQLDDAAACVRQALEAAPDLAAAQAALGSVLLLQRQPEAALEAADAALARDRLLGEAWFVRGTALAALHRDEDAIAALLEAVALRPQDAPSWLNLGNAYGCCDQMDRAEAHVRHALALDPGLAQAHASLGWLLTRQGRLDAAVAACDESIRLQPGFARGYWNRATAHLLAGDFTRGLEDYEWRRHPDLFAETSPRLPGPEWRGESLAGRHLLVMASQGMGDIIQCARYLPLLARQAGQVTLLCPKPVLRLLRQLPVRVLPTDATPPQADVWVDHMSLPFLLGTRIDTIPAPGGYLQARPTPCARRKRRRPRVGVAWAGNPAHPGDARRSMQLAQFAPLLAVPGFEFVSLQIGLQAAAIQAQFAIPDASAYLTDFATSARLIATLDLVVAVDTGTAHLAGALGCLVWIMLPHAPDWRWMTGRDDSPWYSAARLFRQSAPGDWGGLVAQVAAALAESGMAKSGADADPRDRLARTAGGVRDLRR